MRFAYADPPYPGCAKRHYANDPSGIEAAEVDFVALLEHLSTFDAWALSTHTPHLRDLLPLCSPSVRVGAWVKPFAVFRPGVRVAYAWEPVLFQGARPKRKGDFTARDWVSAMPPVFVGKRTGTKGTKPEGFCYWLFDLMGLQPEDEFHDLFPGSGAVTNAWNSWRSQLRLFEPTTGLYRADTRVPCFEFQDLPAAFPGGDPPARRCAEAP